MRKLTVFNFTTLNGYFKGLHDDISWHMHGSEQNQYSVEMLQSGNTLLFGRITYEMMAGYWSSANAVKNNPQVSEGMNKAGKIVFSRTLEKAGWYNSTLIKNNIVDEIKRMKAMPGNDMAILGSGSIVTQFADEGLIDEYQIMIDPVALGSGTPLFSGIKQKLDLALTHTRSFESGVVLLCYQPV
ncbi:MAG TPA: dihydrofolate reductase family protein [Agriterribacter sp.]|nr:dihydrofolate reductase family protein [Agriterribacter sp.]